MQWGLVSEGPIAAVEPIADPDSPGPATDSPAVNEGVDPAKPAAAECMRPNARPPVVHMPIAEQSPSGRPHRSHMNSTTSDLPFRYIPYGEMAESCMEWL